MEIHTIAAWACASFAWLACVGCGASDDPTDDLATAKFARRHHGGGHTSTTATTTSGGGSTTTAGGSTGGTGSAGGCDVCTKANACCNAVGGGPLCTYSAATCDAEPSAAQGAYIGACLMLLRFTFSLDFA